MTEAIIRGAITGAYLIAGLISIRFFINAIGKQRPPLTAKYAGRAVIGVICWAVAIVYLYWSGR